MRRAQGAASFTARMRKSNIGRRLMQALDLLSIFSRTESL
jgi:hypothetical protein